MKTDTKTEHEAPGVSSFEDLYQRYHHKLTRFFTGKGLEPDIAEDLSQETFFRLLRCNKPLESEDHARNFLYRIARNLLIDHFRKHNGSVKISTLAREEFLEEQLCCLAAEEAGPEENLICGETSVDVRSAVSRLPERYAQVIMLKEYEGLSYREIAAQMGVSQKAVESLLHRARSQLKEDLVETGRRRGGWWSGILVGLRGIGERVHLRPLRMCGRMGSKWQGISLGLGAAGAGKGVLNVLAVILLLGSVIGTGAAAISACGNTPAAGSSVEGTVPVEVESDAVETAVSGEASIPAPSGGDVANGGEAGEPAAVDSEPALAEDSPQGGGGLLAATGDAARGVIASAGEGLDVLLADLGRLIGALSDPLAGLLLYAGVPQHLFEALLDLADMEEVREVAAGLVDGVVDATYVLDEAAAVLDLLPPAESGGNLVTPAPPGEEGVAGPRDDLAPADDGGKTAPAAPAESPQDSAADPPPENGEPASGGIVGGVEGLLEDLSEVVDSLLPF